MKRTYQHAATSIFLRGFGIAPEQLVRVAADLRSRRPDAYDEVWCVVDVDEFDVSAAVTEARRQQINLAISNPCFEISLLLHHADCGSHCAGCVEVLRLLKKSVPRYDKSRLRFEDFKAGIADAVERARRLDPTEDGWQRNPSTGMWRLVERIVGKT